MDSKRAVFKPLRLYCIYMCLYKSASDKSFMPEIYQALMSFVYDKGVVNTHFKTGLHVTR